MKSVRLLVTVAVAAASIAGPARAAPDTADEAAIHKALQGRCDGLKALDLKKAMAGYRTDLHVFDMAPPSQRNYTEMNEVAKQFITEAVAPPSCGFHELYIKVYGDNAYARYIFPLKVQLKNGTTIVVVGRGTDIFERTAGKWLIVHEHFSLPVDLVTGQAEMKPPTAP